MEHIKRNTGIWAIIISIVINLIGLWLTHRYFGERAFAITAIMLSLGLILSIIFIKLNKIDDLPSHWVSLGVIFTFISFLIVFKTSTDWNNMNKIIPTISSAFITSIIGIGMSKIIGVYLSIIERTSEDKPGYESPETVLADLRNKMINLIDISNKNNNSITPIFTDISTNISSLNQSVEQSNRLNNDTLSRINETFEKIAGNIGDTINTGLEDVLGNLVNKLDIVVENIGTELNDNIR